MATPNDTTENQEYQLWGDNQRDWEHRSDFEALDTDVEVRDLDANKSQYTPKDDALFRATDTGDIYVGDGSAWQPLNPPGGGGVVEHGNLNGLDDDDHTQYLNTTRHDSEDHQAALDATFTPSTGDHIYYDGSSWGTEQPPDGGSGSTAGTTDTQSGDGSTTAFTIGHGLGATPDGVSVIAASEDASTDFWITNVTSSDVTVTYASAPASGTDNLTWHVVVTDGSGSGSGSGTVSTTVGPRTSDYTSASWDEAVLMDTSGGDLSVELPSPSDTGQFTAKKVADGNTLTVTRPGTEAIDGSASDLSITARVSRTFVSDGSDYEVI